MKIDAKERLIVALDVPDVAAARKMVDELEGVVDFFKIGLTLQLAEGVEELIHSLIAKGKRVFLDYKYYDISEALKELSGARRSWAWLFSRSMGRACSSRRLSKGAGIAS